MPASLPPIGLKAAIERWPLLRPFRIARGEKTEIGVVLVELIGEGPHGRCRGRGEAVPDPRFGESPEAAVAALQALVPRLAEGIHAGALAGLLPAGAARSALDCALWDWQARTERRTVSALAGRSPPRSVVTAYTISLDTPERMAAQAAEHAHFPLLKIKLGDPAGDGARLAAVREAAPAARLIVDANEGWTAESLRPLALQAAELGVEMIEQPLPAGEDAALANTELPLPVCADESLHAGVSLAELAARYRAVNIKLEKAGGLTAALEQVREAQTFGLDILLGSFLGTSLGAAQALTLAPAARWVDLDGPLYLARDRTPALEIRNGVIAGIPKGLWGTP